MREIKFRALGDKYRIWHYGSFVSNSQIDFDSYIQEDSGNLAEIDYNTVGQYTGLHDKNGKEIYEGDMLRSNIWACDCEVVWMDGGFTLKEGETSYNLKANFTDGGYDVDDIEVIGNIHEVAKNDNHT